MDASYRIGFGTDVHRLVEGNGFRLGGVLLTAPYAAVAVSDGDVLLHALVDAILGSMALGDIGEYYSEANVSPGEDSSRFVLETLNRLQDKGGRLVNMDAVVELQSVRFSPYRQAIRERLAGLTGLPQDAVSVKAKTAEGLGAVGRDEAVRAQVVVLVAVAAPASEACGQARPDGESS